MPSSPKLRPLPVNLLSKDFDPIVVEKQNALEEEERSRSTVSSLVEKESLEVEPK